MFWTGTGPRVVKKWEISFVHKHNFLVCSFSLKYYLQLCFSSESFCVLVPKFNLNGKKCIPDLSSVCAGKSLPVSKLNSGGCLSLDIFSKSTKASQSPFKDLWGLWQQTPWGLWPYCWRLFGLCQRHADGWPLAVKQHPQTPTQIQPGKQREIQSDTDRLNALNYIHSLATSLGTPIQLFTCKYLIS